MKMFSLLFVCLLNANASAQSIMQMPTSGYSPKISLGAYDMKNEGTGKPKYYMPDEATTEAVYYTTGVQALMANPGTQGCQNQMLMTGTSDFQKQIKSIGSPFVELMCKEAQRVKVTKDLNPNTCMMLANCFKNKMKISDGSLEMMIKAKQKTASEAIALMSQSTIEQLIDLEELKAYAKNKYDSDFMPKECLGDDLLKIPSGEGITACNTKAIDYGFELAQKNCRMVDGACHADYIEFKKGKESENGKVSLMADYIRQKAQDSVKIPIEEDMSITQEISQMIYKGTESPQDKAKKIMNFLREHYSVLDPVYKNYLKQSLNARTSGQPDPIEQGLVKYITANKNKNPLEMMIELETLRREEAHKILRENCKTSISVPKLCSVVTDILNGAEVAVPEKSFKKLISRQETSVTATGMEDVTMSRQELVEHISRCNTFVLDKGIVKGSSAVVKLSSGMDLFSDTSATGLFSLKTPSLYGISIAGENQFKAQITVKANGVITKKEGLSSAETQTITSSTAEKSNDSIFTTKFSNNQVMDVSYRRSDSRLTLPQVAEKTEAADFSKGYVSNKDDTVKTVTHSADVSTSMGMVNPQQTMTNQRAIMAGPRTTDTFIEPVNELQVKPDSIAAKAGAGNVDYNQLLGKIAGLEDKLAQAQKKSGDRGSEAGADSKPSEESELIKELRNAKNTLNSYNKTQLDVKPVETVSSASTAPVRRQKERAIEDDEETSDAPIVAAASSLGSSSARGQAAGSSGSTSSSNRAPASTASRSEEASDDVKTSSRGPVLSETTSITSANDIVLTRLDGVSNMKATETINKLIISESGKPFYIEEGGLVKQIIPQIVDGKVLTDENGDPIYKTVVKGKVGEFKGDKKEKQKIAIKAASPADVKKQDDQAAPAVRYSELQELIKLKK